MRERERERESCISPGQGGGRLSVLHLGRVLPLNSLHHLLLQITRRLARYRRWLGQSRHSRVEQALGTSGLDVFQQLVRERRGRARGEVVCVCVGGDI